MDTYEKIEELEIDVKKLNDRELVLLLAGINSHYKLSSSVLFQLRATNTQKELIPYYQKTIANCVRDSEIIWKEIEKRGINEEDLIIGY